MKSQFLLLIVLSFIFLSGKAQKSDELRRTAENYYEEGEYAKSLNFYKKAYEVAAERTDYERMANLCVDISSIKHLNGQFQEGIHLCKSGILLYNKSVTKPDSILFKLYSSLGEFYKKINQISNASYYFEEGNSMLQSKKELEKQIPEYVAFHLSNQALMYYDRGDFTKSIHFSNKGLRLAGDNESKAIILNNIGLYYQGLGDFDNGLKSHLQALKIYKHEDFEKCKMLLAIGNDFVILKQFVTAKTYFLKAQALYYDFTKKQQIRNDELEIKCILFNAIAEFHLKQKNRSERLLKQALEKFLKKYGNSGAVLANIHFYLSGISEEQKLFHLQEALRAISIGFESKNLLDNPLEEQLLDFSLATKILNEKATFLYDRYKKDKRILDLNAAIKTYDLSISFIRNNRVGFEARETKEEYVRQTNHVFENYIAALYELNLRTKNLRFNENLLNVIDESRDVLLSDFLKVSRITPRTIPYERLAEERKLAKKINRLKIEVSKTTNDSLQAELHDAVIQQNSLIAYFEKKYPQYYHLKYQHKPINIRLLQKQIPTGDAKIVYKVLSDKILILVITSSSFKVFAKKLDVNLFLKDVKQLHNALSNNPLMGIYTGSDAAIRLYQFLIEPIEKEIFGKTHLEIIQDWRMGIIPFEVLEKGQIINDYLIKKYSISYRYSVVSSILHQKQKRNVEKEFIKAFAPFVNTTYQNFVQLPESKIEVEAITNNFFIDSTAKKSRFFSEINSGNIIHLATHTQVGISPYDSFIQFYPLKTKDSKLFLAEIFDIQLDKFELITLSSCEASNGSVRYGEGILSMSKAFTFAGCPAILSTIWTAHDKSMAFLSIKFYDYLKKGKSKNEALRLAKLDYLSSTMGKKFNHPFYWANFVIIGNTEAIIEPTQNIYWIGFIILAVAGYAILLIRKGLKL